MSQRVFTSYSNSGEVPTWFEKHIIRILYGIIQYLSSIYESAFINDKLQKCNIGKSS